MPVASSGAPVHAFPPSWIDGSFATDNGFLAVTPIGRTNERVLPPAPEPRMVEQPMLLPRESERASNQRPKGTSGHATATGRSDSPPQIKGPVADRLEPADRARTSSLSLRTPPLPYVRSAEEIGEEANVRRAGAHGVTWRFGGARAERTHGTARRDRAGDPSHGGRGGLGVRGRGGTDVTRDGDRTVCLVARSTDRPGVGIAPRTTGRSGGHARGSGSVGSWALGGWVDQWMDRQVYCRWSF